MDTATTIELGGTTLTLRTWPGLHGFRFTRVLLRTVAEFKSGIKIKDLADVLADLVIDPEMIEAVLSDKNYDSILQMIAEGVDVADRAKLRAQISAGPFPELITAFAAVLKFNLVFLAGHVSALFQTMKPNATSTLQASASPSIAASPPATL